MLVPSPFLSSARLMAPVTVTRLMPNHATSAISMMSPTTGAVQTFVLPAVLSIARGGAEVVGAASGLDIGRVRMRLEGLQAYGTLCALLVNACLRLYSSVKIPKSDQKGDGRAGRYAMDVFLFCIVVSVLFGSYTTIVFSLLALYSKTALGRGFDAQFLDFFAATAPLRDSGFNSFIYSLVSFEMAFILSLFLKFEGRRRKMLVVLACLISSISVWRWSTIMRLAAQFLFPLKAEANYF